MQYQLTRTRRDAVAEVEIGTRSVRNSLTATTRVMGVSTDAGRAGRALDLQMFSDAIAATATPTGGSADDVTTAIGSIIGIGVAAANTKVAHS